MSAPNIEDAPLEHAPARFSFAFLRPADARIEAFLEAERGQLPLWFVAAFASGIAAWLWLPGPAQWSAFIVLALGIALSGIAWGQGRLGRALLIGGLALAAGCGLIWGRSAWVAAPRLERPVIAVIEARVERVEQLVAKEDIRLTLAPAGEMPRLRMSLPAKDAPKGLGPGARIRVKARVQPPPPMPLPGGHDFARDAWFAQRGGVGRAIGPIELIAPATGGGLDAVRDRLGAHVRASLPGSAGGVAVALAVGDQAGVSEEDAEAMRRSGLTHLLSVSGLHIAAAVGAAMLLSLRLMALSERLALRFNLVLVAAGVGALAGVAYTLLTGMQVPTMRACIAALLVLGGIALGREAISLRLVAVGALLVLLFRPEALAGASFQLSFAAVTSIIVLHQSRWARDLLGVREEGWPQRLLRGLLGLLLTGLAVELALIPFALYHFHKAGLYGVAANMIAIPLTTFVVMPLEALALLFDSIGLGAPLWTATGWSIDLILGLAHRVADAKGAVAMLPTMPRWAFAALVLGGLWIALWRGPVRRWAVVPLVIGVAGAATAPIPDLLITGDGEHLAIVRPDGVPVLLRARSGDFVRGMMSEAAAFDGDPLALEEQGFARCTRDACLADIVRDGRAWRLLAIRSRDRIDWRTLTTACHDADIVVASRRLPLGCTPRWLKLDRPALAQSGGVALYLKNQPRLASVASRLGQHPWRQAPASSALHTASSLPPGSMKWKRRPPGKE
ncbi:MAG: ComEC family competence protein [Sphingomonas bacterium]|nr:ComEC family competence protein [Sphingomonas bacterium]